MLAQGQLASTTASAVVTVGASETIKAKSIIFHNVDTVTRVVTVYLVPNSSGSVGTASTSNRFYNEEITAGQSTEFAPSYPIVYSDENDTIQLQADAANVVNYAVGGVDS